MLWPVSPPPAQVVPPNDTISAVLNGAPRVFDTAYAVEPVGQPPVDSTRWIGVPPTRTIPRYAADNWPAVVNMIRELSTLHGIPLSEIVVFSDTDLTLVSVEDWAFNGITSGLGDIIETMKDSNCPFSTRMEAFRQIVRHEVHRKRLFGHEGPIDEVTVNVHSVMQLPRPRRRKNHSQSKVIQALLKGGDAGGLLLENADEGIYGFWVMTKESTQTRRCPSMGAMMSNMGIPQTPWPFQTHGATFVRRNHIACTEWTRETREGSNNQAFSKPDIILEIMSQYYDRSDMWYNEVFSELSCMEDELVVEPPTPILGDVHEFRPFPHLVPPIQSRALPWWLMLGRRDVTLALAPYWMEDEDEHVDDDERFYELLRNTDCPKYSDGSCKRPIRGLILVDDQEDPWDLRAWYRMVPEVLLLGHINFQTTNADHVSSSRYERALWDYCFHFEPNFGDNCVDDRCAELMLIEQERHTLQSARAKSELSLVFSD